MLETRKYTDYMLEIRKCHYMKYTDYMLETRKYTDYMSLHARNKEIH